MPEPLVTPIRVRSLARAVELLGKLGVEQHGVDIMAGKAIHHVFRIDDIDVRAANILKQVALSKDGECATPRSIITTAQGTAQVILMGTRSQLAAVCDNLAYQPFGLKKVRQQLVELLDALETKPEVWSVRDTDLDISKRTLVMGVVNVTPDSFSDPGRFYDKSQAIDAAMKMEAEGADIVDIGGESARPHAEPVSVEEELARVLPVIEGLVGRLSIPISIDSRKPEVSTRAVEAGAAIINDITAFSDERMVQLAVESGCGCCVMHMQGEPRTMQENPTYEDVMGEIVAFLRERGAMLADAGVLPEKIAVDPGIGFGKTLAHNLEIFERLGELRGLGFPILVGSSRKRFIGTVLDTDVDERLEGTAATVSYAIVQGAQIVRVHDIKEMARVAKMTDALVSGWDEEGS